MNYYPRVARPAPSKAQMEAAELLDDAVPRAIKRLVELLDSQVDHVALKAAEALADRGLTAELLANARIARANEEDARISAMARAERIALLRQVLEREENAAASEREAEQVPESSPRLANDQRPHLVASNGRT